MGELNFNAVCEQDTNKVYEDHYSVIARKSYIQYICNNLVMNSLIKLLIILSLVLLS